jgi:hypothetical protein
MTARVAFWLLLLLPIGAGLAKAQRISDDDIKKQMIQESIAGYSGACPCPESRKKNGARCGGSSAYSRPGGKSVLCYPTDITQAMVDAYRQRRGR